MVSSKFRCLFMPGRIGRMELKNRIVMAPMGTYLANRDGTVGDRLIRYYEERAKGGAGLIIVEIAAVDHPRGRGMTRQIGISDDKFLPGLSELASAVHRQGAKLGIQLHHGGRIAAPFLSGGFEAVAPSVVPLVPAELGVTRALKEEEIAHLVQCYAGAAVRARNAGIDGVEVHAGHGYLINQFLSRSLNKRQDRYGGSLENRARFLTEILKAVREAVHDDFPVWCRLDGREFSIENGITPEEARQIARMAEQAGADAVHVSGYGGSDNVHFTDAPLVREPGILLPLARGIKSELRIPVIAVGRISPELGEKALRGGTADFIAMGRPLIADPELPRKLLEGRAREIRPCIYCYTCVHQIYVRNNITCAVNPRTGKESEPDPQPPAALKSVVVIGAGPAGMEAALTAARRGHRVQLFEKENRPGGSLVYASLVRRENEDLVRHLAGELQRPDIRLHLGSTFTPAMAEKEKPDAIILATGSVRRRPEVPGIDRRNVLDGDDLRQLLDLHPSDRTLARLTAGQRLVLRTGGVLIRPFSGASLIRRLSGWWMPLGRRITVLGGGLVGCELAVFLAERGRRVTILEKGDQLAPEMPLPMKWIVLDKLEKYRVKAINGAVVREITGEGVAFSSGDGPVSVIEADNVVIAEGTEPDAEGTTAFQGKAPGVYTAGDCGKLSLIKDSITDGRRAGSAI